MKICSEYGIKQNVNLLRKEFQRIASSYDSKLALDQFENLIQTVQDRNFSIHEEATNRRPATAIMTHSSTRNSLKLNNNNNISQNEKLKFPDLDFNPFKYS